MSKSYQSWGNFPRAKHVQVLPLNWRDRIPHLNKVKGSVLPFAQGRSYGDSCLNDQGTLLATTGLDHFMDFDRESGTLRCEAGVTLERILDLAVPHGWFLPVTPGTKYVSVGGAIANDVHGKNHHQAGTFGRFVKCIELLRSDGTLLKCSKSENPQLFQATIGGLGLTGLIVWAEIQLKAIVNAFIDAEQVPFRNLEEFFELSTASEKDFEYSVSWIDSTSVGSKFGRGIFIRGNHSRDAARAKTRQSGYRLTMPFYAPSFGLNSYSVRLFNELYFRRQSTKKSKFVTHYDPFFYPLDSLLHWNRIYGKKGFFQYQLVVPPDDRQQVISEIMNVITRSGMASFLSVLKTFGTIESPGMLSFPRPGVTLALDFSNAGRKTQVLFEQLDTIVVQAGGALYPAKDARMPKQVFEKSFPRLKEFSEFVDPKFSSSFWRRVSTDERKI